MADANLTSDIILSKALQILENNNGLLAHCDRQYDSRFFKTGAREGDTVGIRLPNKYTVRQGKTLSAQDNIEPKAAMVVATQVGVDLNFSSAELALDIDDFSNRILRPAMSTLAADINKAGHSLFYRINQRVGTAGTVPASALVWLQGGQKLDESAVPRDGQRMAIVNPAAMAATVNGLSGLFRSGDRLDSNYKSGVVANDTLGMDFSMDQSVQSVTTGTRTGTILVDGNSSATSWTGGDWTALTGTIHIDGLTGATDTIAQGETFTVGSVYAVNPQTGDSTGSLQVFTVLSAATAASNEVDLSVWPPLITTGPYKTIDALPLDGAAITFYGSASTAYAQNLLIHKECLALGTVDLEDVSRYGAWGSRQTYNGLSMRIGRQWDVNNDNFPCRVDLLIGWKCVRPEMGCRVSA